MGGSSSSHVTTTNENNQTYINKNTLNMLNENVNEASANALIKSNQSCVSAGDISQSISFRGCKIKGNLNITGVRQKAIITVDFSCVNVFKAEQEMAQAMMSELMGAIKSGMDAKAQNAMDNFAKSEAMSAGLFSGSTNASTDSNNKFNLTVQNDNTTNIQNIIKNSINSNFNVESVSSCVSELKIKQDMDFSGCEVGGDVNMSDVEQNGSINAMVKCLNNSGVGQEILNKAATGLGVIVESNTKVVSESEITNKLEATAKSIGLGGGCPSCPCPGCDNPTGCSAWCCGICIVIIIFVCFIYFGLPLLL